MEATTTVRQTEATSRTEQDGYLVYEVLSVKDLQARIEAAENAVHLETLVLLPRGVRQVDDSGGVEENLARAINDQATEDDREGTRYAAVRNDSTVRGGKNYLEFVPTKKVSWSR